MTTTPPPCAWCTAPAAEQVHVGTSLVGANPRRRYAWLCGPCQRVAREEREESMRDE